MWGYSALLETESVLPCLFFVWDNAAPKVMPDPKPIEIPMAKLSRAMPKVIAPSTPMHIP